MNLEIFQEFLYWCMIINMGIYTFSAVMITALRDFILKMHMKIFDLNEDTVRKTNYNYLALYKILIIVFNFVPWLALLLVSN